jgi:hypothetical protein
MGAITQKVYMGGSLAKSVFEEEPGHHGRMLDRR